MSDNGTTKRLPRVIPPKSVVRLARATDKTPLWKQQLRRRFRVGYYSRQDGLDVIWLINERGEYEQTADRATFEHFFDVLRRSSETDLYGDDRPRLRALPGVKRKRPRAAAWQ